MLFYLSYSKPKDAELDKKWQLAIFRGKQIEPSYRICVLHFAENDIVRSGTKCKLTPTAVPSQFVDKVAPDPISIRTKHGQIEYGDHSQAVGDVEYIEVQPEIFISETNHDEPMES